MKRLLALAVMACLCAPEAHAGPDGTIPAPGLCDYPGIGGSGQIMNVYNYWCDFPTEINGSHWHCELGGADLQAAVTAGLSISFFNLSGTLSGQVGAIVGSCSWRCPDSSISGAPNPPGAWKNYIEPAKCKPIGAPPPRPGEDLPLPPGGPVQAASDLLAPPPAPAVTNPDNPNPDATVNPR
jgi:hypothetical protein